MSAETFLQKPISKAHHNDFYNDLKNQHTISYLLLAGSFKTLACFEMQLTVLPNRERYFLLPDLSRHQYSHIRLPSQTQQRFHMLIGSKCSETAQIQCRNYRLIPRRYSIV